MKRLRTDDELRQIELKQIAIDAEKWPRKEVEEFFERQGMRPEIYRNGKDGKFISWLRQNTYTDADEVLKIDSEIELTLPDALRWEELRKLEVECFDDRKVSVNLSVFDKLRTVNDVGVGKYISEQANAIAEVLSNAAKVLKLKEENEALKQRIKELERNGQVEDRRVDFGQEVTFNTLTCDKTAFIGFGLAQEVDENKVLIAGKGYQWQIHEDYYNGQNAVSLIKIG